MKKKMQNCTITKDGELEITASLTSSINDFDFYQGKWKIKNRRLTKRLSQSNNWITFEADQEMQIIILGLSNTDNFISIIDGVPFEGRTIRVFNPQTKLWSMYWTDSISGVLQAPTVGSFEGSLGKFYAKDTFQDQSIIVEFTWDKSNPTNPLWSQAFSADNGNSWETNWHMDMYKNET